jgi:hypothetical protein
VSETPINRFEDFTHSSELKELIPNEDFRRLLRKLADICEGLQNRTSKELPFGIYFFDKQPLLRSLEEAVQLVVNMRVVK